MNQGFLIGLLQNAGLLLAMLVIFDFLSARRTLLATFSGKALAGGALGAIGITMIDASVTFESGIVFDTRSVLLAVAGLFFGVIPCVIAILMTAAFRLYIGGDAALDGVSVIAASGAIGIVWRHLHLRRRRPVEGQRIDLPDDLDARRVVIAFVLEPEPARHLRRADIRGAAAPGSGSRAAARAR